MAISEVWHDLFKSQHLHLIHESLLHSTCLTINPIYEPRLASVSLQQTHVMARVLRPPGFRFYPTEEELVAFYLPNKLEGRRNDLHCVIPVVNVYEHEPWQLPSKAGELCNEDTEQWFFFVPKQEKEVRGGKSSRTTTCGYWKATGSPTHVYSSKSKVIGVKRTMVFYKGNSSKGNKTNWKMNEHRVINYEELDATNTLTIPKLRNELSLCRVYIVSGRKRAFDRRPLGMKIACSSL